MDKGAQVRMPAGTGPRQKTPGMKSPRSGLHVAGRGLVEGAPQGAGAGRSRSREARRARTPLLFAALLLLLTLGRPLPVLSQQTSLELLARQAAQSYGQGRCEEAAQLYLRLAEGGWDGAPVRYDLGNSYLKAGDLGRAILEYRRSLKFDPDLEPAKQNLALARRLLPARVAPWQPPPWESLLERTPPAALQWAVLAPALLGNLALALVLLVGPGSLRRAALAVLVVSLLMAGAGGILLGYARTVLPTHQPAVVLSPASVYAAADDQGKPLAVLPPGSEVIRVAQAADWSLVLWGEGRGWTRSSSVGVP